jgi:hypothetical protein
MDVEQRDEEISRFFTFLFCLLANVVNSQIRAVHNANDMHMENHEGGAEDTHRGWLCVSPTIIGAGVDGTGKSRIVTSPARA